MFSVEILNHSEIVTMWALRAPKYGEAEWCLTLVVIYYRSRGRRSASIHGQARDFSRTDCGIALAHASSEDAYWEMRGPDA